VPLSLHALALAGRWFDSGCDKQHLEDGLALCLDNFPIRGFIPNGLIDDLLKSRPCDSKSINHDLAAREYCGPVLHQNGPNSLAPR
jgi:hypothetical protein